MSGSVFRIFSRSSTIFLVALIDDPLNPKLSYNPMGQNSVVFASGYAAPDWTVEDPDARPGALTQIVLPSRALQRDAGVQIYLPARFRRSRRR